MSFLELAKSQDKSLGIYLDKINRHGLIAGATGTGKTISLKVLTEQLSDQGIPVFLADIKGDLASLAKSGLMEGKVAERVESMGLTDFKNQAYPVRLWDLFQEAGSPVRTTLTEMGPLLLGRLLDLNETQAGILSMAFRIADDQGMALIDMKDLRALLQEMGDHASDYSSQYGNITKQSIGAIQRSLLVLEDQGGDLFFGEPALDLRDFMQVDSQGKGYINILMAQKLFQSPKLYSTFLLWMLSELFEVLPEVGDLPQPKMVFFFDEAHLLFKDAPKAFLEKIEQVVRLIRSKGVGIYFITQNPADLPESILAQLGNRIQHALRAYTPKEIKAVKMAAESFRSNLAFKTEEVITELKVGEALISCLNQEGQPEVVERALIRPPQSYMGTLEDAEVSNLITNSSMEAKYRQAFDRESAFELLQQKVAKQAQEDQLAEERARLEKERQALEKEKERQATRRSPGRPAKSTAQKATDSFFSSVTRTLGRELVRGLFGSLKK